LIAHSTLLRITQNRFRKDSTSFTRIPLKTTEPVTEARIAIWQLLYGLQAEFFPLQA